MKTNKILKTFAQNVRLLRKKKGWSQEELALRSDLHRTYIGSIERCERNVSLLNVERIANALGTKAHNLIK
ncbi:MAG: helix-turn-helix transcriptional regulator [Sedimentisphaerales bacterium]|nr:helix-turn-helix transcriptional regulator [Sedimentisphaerales bacterium]